MDFYVGDWYVHLFPLGALAMLAALLGVSGVVAWLAVRLMRPLAADPLGDVGSMQRRVFLSALATFGVCLDHSSAEADQAREVETYWADLPAGATLWGLAVFLTDEPLELTIGTAKDVQKLRGRFDGQRLQEYSWRNTSRSSQRIAVRATALAGARELAPSRVQFISEQHVYVAFGVRGAPDDPGRPRGSYPFEAVFVGFITFGD